MIAGLPARATASKSNGPAASPGRRNRAAWSALGWFGLMLIMVGLTDILLTWLPLGFGTPEWEFGTVAASYASIPLFAMGLAALLASALGSGRRWVVLSTAALLIVSSLLMAGSTSLFLLNVPIALNLAPAEVMLGIKKTIAKTLVLGTLFPVTFLIAAIVAIRASNRKTRNHG